MSGSNAEPPFGKSPDPYMENSHFTVGKKYVYPRAIFICT